MIAFCFLNRFSPSWPVAPTIKAKSRLGLSTKKDDQINIISVYQKYTTKTTFLQAFGR